MIDSAKLPVNMTDIHEARHELEKYARITPLIQSNYLSRKAKGDVYLKLENMQLTGSFKFRGAYNRIVHLNNEEKENGVIACSAGNHAQGVALSCKLLGIEATVVMPQTAPQSKIEATEGYGATVILHGDSFDEAHEYCHRLADETGLIYIPPYNDRYVMAGQGTIGLEILNQLWDVDNVIVPVGGGGIISGIAVALKTFNPNIKIIGVQAENIHGMTTSFRDHQLSSHKEGVTLADGCAVATPGHMTYEVVSQLVDDMVLVDEEDIQAAIKVLIQRTKIVCEGAGALSTAALLSGKIDPKLLENKKTVNIVSGGNIDLSKLEEIIEHLI